MRRTGGSATPAPPVKWLTRESAEHRQTRHVVHPTRRPARAAWWFTERPEWKTVEVYCRKEVKRGMFAG
jgi:hypothetical protein